MPFRSGLLFRWLVVIFLVAENALATVPPTGESVRTRDRGVCSILLSRPDADTGRVDDTTGIKIAPLDLAALEKLLAEKPALEGVLVIAGLPVYGREKKRFVEEAKAMLARYGISVPVRVITEPKGEGIGRMAQELRYFFPMGSDLQAPVLSETTTSILVAGASNVSLAIFSFSNFPLQIAIPIVAGNTGLDLAAALYRRSIGNWINRSENRSFEKFLKECLLSTVFVSGMYLSSRAYALFETAYRSGVGELFCQIPEGLERFAATQTTTIVMNSLLFTFLFNGMYKWDQLRSQTPEGNRMVRRTSPWILAGLFAALAPGFAMATTGSPAVVDLPGLSWFNWGHAYLGGLAGLGAFAWRNPSVFDWAVPAVDKLIYAPLRLIRSLVVGRAKAENELPLPPEATPPSDPPAN